MRYIFLFSALVLVACHSKKNSTTETAVADSSTSAPKAPASHHYLSFEKGKVLTHIKCVADGSKMFSLYLPADYDTARSWPIVIFLDAHARGKLPLNKYKDLAEKHHAIFMGSEDSKNSLQDEAYDEIVNNLLMTAKSEFHINETRIVLAGFSGGAKVAGMEARRHSEIYGVIGCAAPMDAANAAGGSFVYAGIAGKGDFNYWDMLALDASLGKSQVKHYLYTFDGIHEWPDAPTMDKAIKAMLDDNAPATEHPDAAGQEAELATKQDYMKAFQNQSPAFWMGEIKKLQAQYKGGSGQTKWSARRLLSFINMLSYLRASENLNGNHLDEAMPYMQVFRASDAANPDGPYLYADYYALKGDKTQAIKSLNEAMKLNYDDYDHFAGDPMLASIRNDEALVNIGKKLSE